MFKLFKEKYPDSTISYNTYRDIFNAEFSLRFGLPRSDTCKLCDKYYIETIAAEDQNKIRCIEKLAEAHHKKAEKAYSKLSDDTKSALGSSHIVALCVDLQQVIYTPNLTHTDVFYQRQYSNYNFAIHNLGQNTIDMYTWHETVAKRGAAEIASCILRHITSTYAILKAGDVRKLIIWSDRCVGQNNNWTMIALIYHLIKMKYFSEANQKFLVSGHSFLPCDRDFSLIERKKKTVRIYTTEDVHEMIKSAKPSNPFRVHQMLQIDFKNFDVLIKNLNKNTCKITEGRWLQITADDMQVLRLRMNHSTGEPWHCHSLRKKSKCQQKYARDILRPYELPVLRKKPIAISAEKKKDLLVMAVYLPNQDAEFYRAICS
ncbi:uncharacterized protein LOC120780771 [Bactrocera tryoni]|uniref:uncharacterized protein LOC120780771 n=1 Tax=Bactrocera tryoni TaxID=59916 RepID=UPI001A957492|nr:uncharacterized protein LOC120780771 [Bactrocera tryoni]